MGAPERPRLVVTHWAHPDVADYLAGGRRLRVISATLPGCDNFDDAACARRGGWLTTQPGCEGSAPGSSTAPPSADPSALAGAQVTRLGWFSLREVSDVVVLALPPTADTRHLLGAEALAARRPGTGP